MSSISLLKLCFVFCFRRACIVHQSNFMMIPVKSLQENSNNSVILLLASNDFELKFGVFCTVMRFYI